MRQKIAGITPTSIRRGSRQGYLDAVFSVPDGATPATEDTDAEPRAGY